jgi:hypothetical protein
MAVGLVQPFQPTGGTVALSAGTTSVNATLPSGGESVLVFNNTTVVVFVRVDGPGAVASTTYDLPVPIGGRVILNAGTYATTAAVIATAVGTGSVYFTRGSGTAY